MTMEPNALLLSLVEDVRVPTHHHHQHQHHAVNATHISSSSSGCDSSTDATAAFDLGLLSARIGDTDLLVKTLHQQTQEIADLKAQLSSLNQSVAHVTTTANADQQLIARLQEERAALQRDNEQLRTSLDTAQSGAINERSLHTQELAAVEQRAQLTDSELIDVCRQYLVQGNLLADHHLSNGALNRHYMKVAELLKRRGECVDGLVRTTNAKRRRPRSCTVGTQTVEVARSSSTRTMATMTAKPVRGVSCGTMTNEVMASPPPAKVLCDRATQALPTTTTRGTSTPATRSVSVGTTCSPPPISMEEIFRQTIVALPMPLSPIAELRSGATAEIGCQTAFEVAVLNTEDIAPPKRTAVEVSTGPVNVCTASTNTPSAATHQTVGTITKIANIRKRIEYARKRTPENAASAPPQQQQQQLYDIKKEESSPFGSLQDLTAAFGDANGAGPDAMFDMLGANRAINPHLAGLWRVLGQMIFSIIGSGRIFNDGGTSELEMINRNLSRIRNAVELAQLAGDVDPDNADSAESVAGDEVLVDVLPAKEGYMESAVEEDGAPVTDYSAMSATSPSRADVPKIRVVSDQIAQHNTGAATATDTIPPQNHTSANLQRLIDATPAGQTVSTTVQSSNAATSMAQSDDAIFKRPTSAVRLMSVRQRALVRKNLARTARRPIISPPSYSIDRIFKRTRRKSISNASLFLEWRQPAATAAASSSSSSSPADRCGRRNKRKAPALTASLPAQPDRKRECLNEFRFDNIAQYFSVPELIEPIDELDLDEDMSTDDQPPAVNVTSNGGLSAVLLHDLFGDEDSSSSDSDSDDEPMEHPVERIALNELVASPDPPVVQDLPVCYEPPAVPERIASPEPTAVQQERIASPEPLATFNDSDYSPVSPTSPPAHDTDQPAACPPIRIPTKTALPTSRPLLSHVLDTYSNDKLKYLRKRTEHIDCADPQRFARLHSTVRRYLCDAEFSATTADECVASLFAQTNSHRWLATCLQEHIEDIDVSVEPLDLLNTPPAPALTPSAQRLVLLVMRLDDRLAGFRRFCQLTVEQTLFTFAATKPSIECIINLVRYHLALDDLQPVAGEPGAQRSRTRLFIYKCLYYFQHTATPMVYTVLLANPLCLPAIPSASDLAIDGVDGNASPAAAAEVLVSPRDAFGRLDPLVQALHVVLANTSYAEPSDRPLRAGAELYRKPEMLQLLRHQYKYPAERHSYADLVGNMLQRIRDGRLHNVANALILCGKRNGVQWTKQHLLDATALPQLLRQHALDEEEDADQPVADGWDERIVCLLHTVASLVKPFPITEDVSSLQELFGAVLAACRRHEVQEAAVSALLQTARFGAINVYRHVRGWQPDDEVSRELWLRLQSFVHRRPRQFWT